MIKRPKAGEDEEDLLKLQDEFLKNKVNPSVTVVKAGDKRKAESSKLSEAAPEEKQGKIRRDVVQMTGGMAGVIPGTFNQPKKQSKFKAERSNMPGTSRSQRVMINLDDNQDPYQAMDAKDSDLHSVLTQIMERDVQNIPVYLPRHTTQGFPTVLHRGQSSSTSTSGKKKSLFAQQVEATKPSSFGVPVAFPPVAAMTFTKENAADNENVNRKEPSSTEIVSGGGLQSEKSRKESDSIHEENVKKMEAMSEEEILQEQKKLLEMLDPNIVKFLQSKKGATKPDATVSMETSSNIETDNEGTTQTIQEHHISNKDEKMEEDVHVEASSSLDVKKEWVNMAEVETEKLAWMNDLPEPKAISKEGHLARFDFNGRLLARDAKIPVREGLHHHGDEQEVPGYTVDELFMLSRSTVQSQRVIGLQTLARVVYSYRINDIGGELQKPLIPMLLESGYMLLVRWALDDATEVVIGAAAEALASFLINPGDEVCAGDLVTDVYNYPVIPAVKLIRILCLSGRNMAAVLNSKFSLVSIIIRYVTVEPTDMQMNIGEAYNLSIESFKLWHVLTGYGLSCDAFRELYPLFMQQLQLFQRLSILPLSVTEEQATVLAHHLQLLRASAIFCVLEGVVNVAGTAAHLQAQLKMRSKEDPLPDQTAPPPIDWSHVSGLLGPVELCFQKWMAEMSRAELPLEMEAMSLVGCCMNFLTSFYDKLKVQPSYNSVECLEHLEVLISKPLMSYMTSSAFYSSMLNLRNHSSCNFKPGISTSLPQLPDFGCHMANDQMLHPCVQRQSAFGVMGSLFKLVTTFLKIHKGMAGKFCAIIESNHVIGYLERVVKKRLTCSNCPATWFSKFEHHVLFLILKLYHLVVQQNDNCHQHSKVYHNVALVLFTSLHAGDEHLAHELISTVLFNTDFIIEGKVGDPIAADLADFLTTSDTTRQQSVAKNVALGSKPEVSRGELLHDAYSNLASIRATYMVLFATLEQDVLVARARANQIPHEIQNFVLPAHTGQLAPTDWVFMPLLHLYSETQTAEMLGKSVQSFPPRITNTVINSLRWIFLMETWRAENLKVVPLAAKMTRLFCLFLTGNDLFFEDQVRSYLTHLMTMYTCPSWEQQLDFNIPIPGVASFPDLYFSLLTQFAAVSFGDHLFGHAILLPLQQRFSSQLRRAIWSEHAGVLRSLSIPVNKFLIPLEGFLKPVESNHELLTMYISGLATGTIKQLWCPVLYLVAIHHLNSYIFKDHSEHENENVINNFKKKMVYRVKNLKDQNLQNHLLFYKCLNKSLHLGFDVYEQLPPTRLEILHKLER